LGPKVGCQNEAMNENGLVYLKLMKVETKITNPICATIQKLPSLHYNSKATLLVPLCMSSVHFETFKYTLLIHSGHEVAQMVTWHK